MATEVRERIMALLAQEPHASILRQLEFLERDLARLEAPATPPAQGNYLSCDISIAYFTYLYFICF